MAHLCDLQCHIVRLCIQHGRVGLRQFRRFRSCSVSGTEIFFHSIFSVAERGFLIGMSCYPSSTVKLKTEFNFLRQILTCFLCNLLPTMLRKLCNVRIGHVAYSILNTNLSLDRPKPQLVLLMFYI